VRTMRLKLEDSDYVNYERMKFALHMLEVRILTVKFKPAEPFYYQRIWYLDIPMTVREFCDRLGKMMELILKYDDKENVVKVMGHYRHE